jgi:CheY-like chemotaxis protein
MPRTILVIDDNPDVREVLRRMLELRGYSVLVADDGAAGLDRIANASIDGALVDLDMPLMNGLTVCRAIRDQAATVGRRVVVWLMTGIVRPELEAEVQDAGAIGVLHKPFTTAELVRRLEEAFQRTHGMTAA